MPCWDHKKGRRWCAGFFCGPFPTPCRFATSPFQGECGRSLSRLPVPPGRRIAPTCGTAPDGAIARLCRAPFVPSRAYISPCAPEGTGERVPPHGFAVPLRSASASDFFLPQAGASVDLSFQAPLSANSLVLSRVCRAVQSVDRLQHFTPFFVLLGPVSGPPCTLPLLDPLAGPLVTLSS